MTLPEGFVPRRVLIVRPRGLGDVVLSSGVIDALARAFPAAEIHYLSEAPSRPFLESDARLTEIFLLGASRPPDARIRGGSTGAAIAWARERGFDIVFDLFSNPRTALMSGLSGAKWRVGYNRGARSIAYNIRVPRFHGDAKSDTRWAGEVQLDFLRDAGIRWRGEAVRSVALTAEDTEFAESALRALAYGESQRPGALLPGGSWPEKRWTVEGFVASGAAVARATGARALVLWGPPEREEAEAIAARLGTGACLAPPTTLRQMAALIARLGVLVAPDCLGRHVAIVQDIPTVGIFAATDPKDWTPPSGPHRVVRTVSSATGPDEGSAIARVVAEIEATLAAPFLDTPRGRS